MRIAVYSTVPAESIAIASIGNSSPRIWGGSRTPRYQHSTAKWVQGGRGRFRTGRAGFAEELAKMGYGVTIFDNSLVPGRVALNGTPTFKLEKSIISAGCKSFKSAGCSSV